MAGRWPDPQERIQAPLRVPGPRCRAAVRGSGHRDARVVSVHQRAGAQGAEEATRLPGIRQGMYAADATRSNDGLRGRGVRGVLRLRTTPGGGGERKNGGTSILLGNGAAV